MFRTLVSLLLLFVLVGCSEPAPSPPPSTAVPTAVPVATSVPPTVETVVPVATLIPPTAVPPTVTPPAVPTAIPPTAVPPTAIPPTVVPPTAIPPTAVPPTPTPIARPSLDQLRDYMLDLVNGHRATENLKPLVLGNNPAAQMHAEAALAGGFNSHWDLNGLKPGMRYTLAGGYHFNQENVFRNICTNCGVIDIVVVVEESVQAWMDSPGHRKEIMRPTHRKLNVGLAWEGGTQKGDNWVFNAVQQFETDFLTYLSLPTIDAEGYLSLSGTLTNGLQLTEGSNLGLYVYYHEPPRTLTLGQLQRVAGVTKGLYVAKVRPPAPPGTSYKESSAMGIVENELVVSPYSLSPDLPPVWTKQERQDLKRAARSLEPQIVESTRYRITAEHWDVGAVAFDVRADLNVVLDEYGPGVYDVILILDDENIAISEYTVFWRTQ